MPQKDALASLLSHRPLVERMAQCATSSGPALLDLSPGEDDRPWLGAESAVLSGLLEALAAEKPHLSVRVRCEMLIILYSQLGLIFGSSSGLLDHLHLLMQRCESVDASCSGLNHWDLLQFVAGCAAPAPQRMFHVQHLDLRHNRFLAYCDHSWMGPFSASSEGDSQPEVGAESDGFWSFAEALLTQCAQLQTLNLSGCATTDAQALCLSGALVAALKLRHSLGMSPLHSLTIAGLQRSFPAAATKLKAGLADDLSHQLLGVQHLDCGGRALRTL